MPLTPFECRRVVMQVLCAGPRNEVTLAWASVWPCPLRPAEVRPCLGPRRHELCPIHPQVRARPCRGREPSSRSHPGRRAASGAPPPLPGLYSPPPPGGGIRPNCRSIEKLSTTCQCSAILPSCSRWMSMPAIVKALPVGGIPRNSPTLVPEFVHRTTTLSPSAMRSSMVKRESSRSSAWSPGPSAPAALFPAREEGRVPDSRASPSHPARQLLRRSGPTRSSDERPACSVPSASPCLLSSRSDPASVARASPPGARTSPTGPGSLLGSGRAQCIPLTYPTNLLWGQRELACLSRGRVVISRRCLGPTDPGVPLSWALVVSNLPTSAL